MNQDLMKAGLMKEVFLSEKYNYDNRHCLFRRKKMLQIAGTSFGKIKINDKTYRYDIYILPGYVVEKRKKKLSKKIHGHTSLGEKEIDYVLSTKPSVLFIGMGQYGILPFTPETKKTLEKLDITVIKGKTPEIVTNLNEELERSDTVAAILHITC